MIDKNIPAVLGVGNALVDVISVIDDDSLLNKFELPRGSMTLVDAERSQQIYAATYSENSTLTTGGSVANTMRSFVNMGGNGGYMGKVGKDKLGDLFKDDFERRGLRTHLSYSENGTGRVMGLVSRDSERTMATYLGAASELQPYDFTPGLFSGYKYLYMEGYLVFNHELIKAGVEKAKAAGLKVAIDLSSFNVVDANLEFLKDLIKENIDIVIANEEEARSYTGLDPEAALHEIAKDCELAIVKIGKEGSLIKYGGEVTRIGIVPAKAVDTTGAGDAYAAGFFYGLTKGYPMSVSGKIAALISGKVVEVMGPNLPDTQWPELIAEIDKIVSEA